MNPMVYFSMVSQLQFPSQSPPGGNGLSKAEKAQADKEQAWAKTMKSVSWPEMDDDAVPSAYVVKVLSCLGKWQLKVGQLQSHLEQFDENECIAGWLGYHLLMVTHCDDGENHANSFYAFVVKYD